MSIYDVSVIIPTLCDSRRECSLKRSIDSVINQVGVSVEVIVVVNGDRFNQELLDYVSGLNDVKLFSVLKANVSKARYFGLSKVSTDFFMFLDDDDELYENSLGSMVEVFKRDNSVGLVVSDVDDESIGGRVGFYRDARFVEDNPVESLVYKNWLMSGGALFRKGAVSLDIFDISLKYNELTVLAMKVALSGVKLKVVDESFSYKYNSSISASKTIDFCLSYVETVECMLRMNLPFKVRVLMRHKLSSAFHSASVILLNNGDFKDSIFMHVKSICIVGGQRYFFYTRHVFGGVAKFYFNRAVCFFRGYG